MIIIIENGGPFFVINSFISRFPIGLEPFTMENFKRRIVRKTLKERKLRHSQKGETPLDVTSPSKFNEESLKKGIAFEKFVVKRFDPAFFTLIDWRSDKTVSGIFPVMNHFPDLELYYESTYESKYFAIECKWREDFSHGIIELKKEQIEHYRYYEKMTKDITYIVLGVGNEPSYPNEVYIIPLKEITDGVLHEMSIEIFRRPNPYLNFFLECRNDILR